MASHSQGGFLKDDATGALVISGQSTVGAVAGTVLILGTSLETNEGSDWPLVGAASGGTTPAFLHLGPLNWASWFSGAAFRPVKNVAASVLSNAQLANIQNSAHAQYALGVSPAPGFIWLGHVTGDDSNTSPTAAQSAANDLAIYNLMRRTYPSSVIILPTLPGVNITGNPAVRATVNPQRRLLALQNPNTLLFDYEGVFIDPTTGLPPAAWSQDVIHPNPTGAMVIGRALATLLAPFLPPKCMVNDYTNDTRVTAGNGGWGTGATMPGTPGAATTATGWTFTGPAGATRALVARTDKFGNWQEMIYGGTAGPLRISRAFPSVFPTNAVVQAECELQFLGTIPATGITDISLVGLFGNAGFSQIGTITAMGNTLNNQGPFNDPGNGTVLTLRTPPLVMPAGMATVASQLQIQMDGTAVAGGFRVGRASVLRLA